MNPKLIGLDPLFLTNVKLFIKDIRSLKAMENVSGEFYNLHDHIIKLVEICGIIVGIEQTSSRIIYTVDDSSGTIACIMWESEVLDSRTPLKLGDLVRVYGKIETVEEDRRIATYEIFELDDPNEELLHSVQTMVLDTEYRKPYTLPKTIKCNKVLLIDETAPETTDIQPVTDEDVFTMSLLQFLKDNSNDTAFMISLPRRNTKLISMAKEVISKKQANEPSKRQVTHLFEDTITSLCRKNLVISSIDKPGMFELVDEFTVEKFILNIMKDILNQASSRVNGVRLEYIMARARKEFQELEVTYIENVMDSLFKKGLIYCIGDKEYRIAAI